MERAAAVANEASLTSGSVAAHFSSPSLGIIVRPSDRPAAQNSDELLLAIAIAGHTKKPEGQLAVKCECRRRRRRRELRARVMSRLTRFRLFQCVRRLVVFGPRAKVPI